MRVLQDKKSRKTRTFGVKIPSALRQKIEDLDAKVKAAGYTVDWAEPCAQALEKIAAAVESDLAEVGQAGSGANG